MELILVLLDILFVSFGIYSLVQYLSDDSDSDDGNSSDSPLLPDEPISDNLLDELFEDREKVEAF